MRKPATLVEGTPIQSGLDTISRLNPRYLRERTGNFTDSRLTAKLGSIPTSELVLLPEHISGISTDDTANRINLTEIPRLSVGRENSRNNVKFGQLHIASEETLPATELVAAKYLHPIGATRELHAALEINRRFGENVTFRPIGFVRHPDTNKIGHLSRYKHGVNTLDNVLWDNAANATLREEAMGFAGLWLATLHNHDILHGDAQAKNIAYNSSRAPRYPDLEGAQAYDPSDPMSRIQRLGDVSDVFNRVFMPATTPAENEAFTEAYLEHQAPNVHYVDGRDIQEVIRQAQDGHK